MENMPKQTPAVERLPWHKPEVQRLVVNLDTRDAIGSGVDLLNEENP